MKQEGIFMKKVLALVLAVLFVMTCVAMAEESKGTLTMGNQLCVSAL